MAVFLRAGNEGRRGTSEADGPNLIKQVISPEMRHSAWLSVICGLRLVRPGSEQYGKPAGKPVQDQRQYLQV